MPPDERGKNSIHLILSPLRKAEALPASSVGGAHAFDQAALPHDRGAILLTAVLTVSAATLRDRSDAVMLPEHTAIHVTLDQAVASNQSRPGDHFDATVSEPVVVDGQTVIPQGAHAEGLVVDSRQSGRLMGRAQLQLALQTVAAAVNLAWIGGGAGGGALIGALAGGGTGVLIGGPVGAGAGATVALLIGRKDIKLRAETPLQFELAEPVTIKVKG
ncbi:MAG: hypothetical protein DMG49_14655 [Acidobacteria bacterium]|nr:MAG: hypothetical protein DMG49_14655 [Acidobacteriota bacterium]